MITTNDGALADRLRLLRQHAMSVKDTERHNAKSVVIEEYLFVGYNYRMTDIQAAMGIEQMKKLPGIIERRQELAARYAEKLASHPWLSPPYVPTWAEPSFQSYAVTLGEKAPISRNDLMQRLLDNGIATRRGIMLSHVEVPYASMKASLPRSEEASARSILIPLYPQMTHADQDTVVDARFGLTN